MRSSEYENNTVILVLKMDVIGRVGLDDPAFIITLSREIASMLKAAAGVSGSLNWEFEVQNTGTAF